MPRLAPVTKATEPFISMANLRVERVAGVFPIMPGCARAPATSQSCRMRTNPWVRSSPPYPPERNDLVVDVVADVGAAEIRDAGALAPLPSHLLLACAKIRVVSRNGTAATELDPGDSANARGAGEMEETA